jgi:hypothetical protein
MRRNPYKPTPGTSRSTAQSPHVLRDAKANNDTGLVAGAHRCMLTRRSPR